MSQTNPIYSFQNVSHIYPEANKILSLDDINLEINATDTIALIGEIGSGKSTLLKLMMGLLRPTKGTIRFQGEPFPSSGEKLRNLRQTVGIMFQFAEAQIFEETVSAEIAYAPQNFGFAPQAIPGMVAEAMAIVGLSYGEFRDKSPFELSGGEKKKVALASVLAFKPQFLLLDEPASGLDYSGRTNLLSILSHKSEAGEGFVLVTHDLDLAMEICDRVLILYKGKIVYNGDRGIFYNDEQLQKWGLESPELVEYWQGLWRKGVVSSVKVYSINEAQKQLSVVGRQ